MGMNVRAYHSASSSGWLICGGSLVASFVFGAMAIGVRKLLPIALNCPSCEIRLDELGKTGKQCPYCDARLNT